MLCRGVAHELSDIARRRSLLLEAPKSDLVKLDKGIVLTQILEKAELGLVSESHDNLVGEMMDAALRGPCVSVVTRPRLMIEPPLYLALAYVAI
jgi:hypothetical protein